MRIIAGNQKGRRLHPLGSLPIRPTADRLRESIFNILTGLFEGAIVLDLFAGTGSLGIEALSRGAESCVFVDNSDQAIHLVRRNLATCGLADQATVMKRDITRGLRFLNSNNLRFDMVFVDPPYNKGHVTPTLRSLSICEGLDEKAWIVVEHSTSEETPEEMTHLKRTDRRCYGKTLVSFYRFVV